MKKQQRKNVPERRKTKKRKQRNNKRQIEFCAVWICYFWSCFFIISFLFFAFLSFFFLLLLFHVLCFAFWTFFFLLLLFHFWLFGFAFFALFLQCFCLGPAMLRLNLLRVIGRLISSSSRPQWFASCKAKGDAKQQAAKARRVAENIWRKRRAAKKGEAQAWPAKSFVF